MLQCFDTCAQGKIEKGEVFLTRDEFCVYDADDSGCAMRFISQPATMCSASAAQWTSPRGCSESVFDSLLLLIVQF